MNSLRNPLGLLALALIAGARRTDAGDAQLEDGTIVPRDELDTNLVEFGSEFGESDDPDLAGVGDDDLDFGEIEQISDAFGRVHGPRSRKRLARRLSNISKKRGRVNDRLDDRAERITDRLNAGAPKRKLQPGVLGKSATVVSGTTVYQLVIESEAPFEIDELILTGPAGTRVTRITVGESQIQPGGESAIEVYGPTATARGLAAGKTIRPGVRVTVDFITSATSGIINLTLTGEKSPSC